MDLFWALEWIALVLTGFLVGHSLIYRGPEFTALFFIGGAVLGLIRENIVARVSALNLYSYNPETFHLWIGAAPLILMVFWSYTIYLALTLSEGILGGDFLAGKRKAAVILLSMIFMAAYACLNEAFASLFPMVVWKFKPALTIWGGTPAMVLWGYAGMAFIFLTAMGIIHKRKFSILGRIFWFSASTLIMIPLHFIWIAIFRLITNLGK
jgi:hypothetical protein